MTASSTQGARHRAYAADITYVPVTEAGFDILRDRLVMTPAQRVRAVLLDEGRVPLVLAAESGQAPRGPSSEVTELVSTLEEKLHYEVDQDHRSLHTTEAEFLAMERWFPDADLFGADDDLLAETHVALHAHVLLVRDVDYVIRDSQARLVSAARGPIEQLQRWPEGLQSAVETKEGAGGGHHCPGWPARADDRLHADGRSGHRHSVGPTVSGTRRSSHHWSRRLPERKVAEPDPRTLRQAGRSWTDSRLERTGRRRHRPSSPEPPRPSHVTPEGQVLDSRLAQLPGHAQQVSDGAHQSLRSLTHRYGRLLGLQRRSLLSVREDWLTSEQPVWTILDAIPDVKAALLKKLPRSELIAATRISLLNTVDQAWSDHLAYAADVREGIHLQTLVRENPLDEFNNITATAWPSLVPAAVTNALSFISRARVCDGRLDLEGAGLQRPSATWAHTVTDNSLGSEAERMAKARSTDARRSGYF